MDSLTVLDANSVVETVSNEEILNVLTLISENQVSSSNFVSISFGIVIGFLMVLCIVRGFSSRGI